MHQINSFFLLFFLEEWSFYEQVITVIHHKGNYSCSIAQISAHALKYQDNTMCTNRKRLALHTVEPAMPPYSGPSSLCPSLKLIATQFQKHEDNDVEIIRSGFIPPHCSSPNLSLTDNSSTLSFSLSRTLLIFVFPFQSSVHYWHEWYIRFWLTLATWHYIDFWSVNKNPINHGFISNIRYFLVSSCQSS